MKPIRSALGALAVIAASLLGGGRARAGEGFDAQNWKPALDPYGYVTVEGARTLGPLTPHAALYLSWTHDPLEVEPARPGGIGRGSGREVVRDILQLDLVAGLGLVSLLEHGGLEVGVALSGAPILHGEALDVDPATGRPDDLDSSLGDLRTAVKATLFDREKDLVGLAGKIELDWATGRERSFLSNKGLVTTRFSLVVEKKISPVRFGCELGYDLLPLRSDIASVAVDDKIRVSGGVAIEPFDAPFAFVGEVIHWFRAGHPYDTAAESPVELGGALKYTGKLFAVAGANAGLNHGIGAPEVRVYGGIGVTF